jgi:hypothetical protein
MSIKYRIIRGVIAWINRVDPYILRELVVPEGSHIQRNPKKRKAKAERQENERGSAVA